MYNSPWCKTGRGKGFKFKVKSFCWCKIFFSCPNYRFCERSPLKCFFLDAGDMLLFSHPNFLTQTRSHLSSHNSRPLQRFSCSTSFCKPVRFKICIVFLPFFSKCVANNYIRNEFWRVTSLQASHNRQLPGDIFFSGLDVGGLVQSCGPCLAELWLIVVEYPNVFYYSFLHSTRCKN